MKKLLLTYGIIFGIIQLFSAILMYESVMGIYQIAGISLLITIVFLIVAIKQFKKSNGGFAAFQDILKLTLGIYLVGLVLGLSLTQVYLATKSEEWKQEFVSEYIEDQLQMFQGFGVEATDEMEEELTKAGDALFSLKASVIGSLNSLFFIIILAIILGLIFKKEPPQITT